jgi:hypothetical protein
MKLKLYYTLCGNAIISRIFDNVEDMRDFRAWVEDHGGDTRLDFYGSK